MFQEQTNKRRRTEELNKGISDVADVDERANGLSCWKLRGALSQFLTWDKIPRDVCPVVHRRCARFSRDLA